MGFPAPTPDPFFLAIIKLLSMEGDHNLPDAFTLPTRTVENEPIIPVLNSDYSM
jgi:hypothetical protein